MKLIRLFLLLSVLLGWQGAVRAGDAVMLKSYSYEVVRGGYPMARRILRVGQIVKVTTTHGRKADVVTPGGDTVTVPIDDLRMLPDTQPATGIALQPPVAPTPPPPVLYPSPSPSPAGGEKADASTAGGARPSGESTDPRTTPVRCSHLTKKGEQCSRMTTSPNGLCWQHGGN